MHKDNIIAVALHKYRSHIVFCHDEFLTTNIHLFSSSKRKAIDAMVIFWVLNKTTRFGLLTFTYSYLLSSSVNPFHPAVSDCMTVSTFYRHFRRLLHDGIFLEQGGYYPREYVVNFPFMIQKINTAWPDIFSSKKTQEVNWWFFLQYA